MTTPSERRRSRRRPILDTFSVFVVLPERAPHRLPVVNASDEGVGFQLDPDSGDPELFPLVVGDHLELCFYLNQTLYLPLRIQIVRISQTEPGKPRMAGARILESESPGIEAFKVFVQLLDTLAELAE
jgi:hypothetical protein